MALHYIGLKQLFPSKCYSKNMGKLDSGGMPSHLGLSQTRILEISSAVPSSKYIKAEKKDFLRTRKIYY